LATLEQEESLCFQKALPQELEELVCCQNKDGAALMIQSRLIVLEVVPPLYPVTKRSDYNALSLI